MLRLAAPLALAELGWMAMGMVDTIMAGPLGPAAVGAGSLGTMVFYPLAICCAGLLLGMDTLVAQAFGAEDAADCRRTLVNGLWLGAALAPLVLATILAAIPACAPPAPIRASWRSCAPYLHALLWGVLPLLLYTAFRRYLQAVNVVKPVTFALVSANLVNFAGNWVLMYGHWGAPAMGLEGSGWSTSFSRVYMAAVLLAAVLWHERTAGDRLFHRSPGGRTGRACGAWSRWASRRRTDRVRRRGVRHRHGAGRAAGRSFAGRARHRRQRDLHHLHGAAGHQLGRGGARGAGGGPQGRARRGGGGLDRRCC